MSKAIYITATGTNVGKTYVAGMIVKKLIHEGLNASYYKPIMRGVAKGTGKVSDVSRVVQRAGLQKAYELNTYCYRWSAPPHLAAQKEGKAIEVEEIIVDYKQLIKEYNYLVVEGVGGIITAFRYDDKEIMQIDVIRALNLEVILVADSNLDTLNSVFLTVQYLQSENIKIAGIILNNYDKNSEIDNDNWQMIEKLTTVKVVGTVAHGGELIMHGANISQLFS